MTFEEWLATCPKQKGNGLIGKTTINHYIDGLRSSSKEAIENQTIDKPLEDMSISELDLALSLIYSSDWFIKKR